MKTKLKWKLFAIGHFFSNDMSAEQAEAMYDKLMWCETDEDVEELLDADEETLVWCEFEDMPRLEMAEAVVALAEQAQEVEAMP